MVLIRDSMDLIMMNRRKRSDRNYIIYSLSINGDDYIGLTVANGRAYWKSLKLRVQKHISRSQCENKQWNLYKVLANAETVEYSIIEVIRGRKAAYEKERELIKTIKPVLNTF